MPDHAMGEIDPLVAWDHSHQILLNLAGFALRSEFQSSRDAIDMRIHDHALSFPKPGTEDDVGTFTSGSRYREELLHFIRHFPAKLADDLLRRANHRLRFITKKSS